MKPEKSIESTEPMEPEKPKKPKKFIKKLLLCALPLLLVAVLIFVPLVIRRAQITRIAEDFIRAVYRLDYDEYINLVHPAIAEGKVSPYEPNQVSYWNISRAYIVRECTIDNIEFIDENEITIQERAFIEYHKLSVDKFVRATVLVNYLGNSANEQITEEILIGRYENEWKVIY